MREARNSFYRDPAHRGLAAALVLLALLMQAISPYLPMPAMGGMTSWDLALTPCPMHETGSEHKAPAQPSQDSHCTVCTVMCQAGSTIAPADVILPYSLVYQRVERDKTHHFQIAGVPAHAFSSRAPPHA